jgi:hypothetical protein
LERTEGKELGVWAGKELKARFVENIDALVGSVAGPERRSFLDRQLNPQNRIYLEQIALVCADSWNRLERFPALPSRNQRLHLG